MKPPDAKPTGFDLGPAYIAALEPWGLAHVPGYDENKPNWREEYFVWAKEIIKLRSRYEEALETDLVFRAEQMVQWKKDWSFFVTMMLWIEEPRVEVDEDGNELPMVKYFVPYAFQVQIVQAFQRINREPEPFDVWITKCREMGATWIIVAAMYAAWLFTSWKGRVISAKGDNVDRGLDEETIFGKLDFLLLRSPDWLLPKGFIHDNKNGGHRGKASLKNPQTGATIIGEATTKDSLRSTRCTYAVADEAAFFRDLVNVLASMQGATRHSWLISSESVEKGEAFTDGWNAALLGSHPESVIQVDWFHNPRFNHNRMDEIRQRFKDQGNLEQFMVEYMRDAYAARGSLIYPMAKFCKKINDYYDETLPVLISIDPGVADYCGIVFAHMVPHPTMRRIRVFESYMAKGKTAEWYAHLLTGIEPIKGDSCYGIPMGERENTIMELARRFYENPDVRCYMDPAGSQRSAGGLSFYDVIVKHSRFLRKRHQERLMNDPRITGNADLLWKAKHFTVAPIKPIYLDLFKFNDHTTRQSTAVTILRRTEFTGPPNPYSFGAQQVQLALSRYEIQTETGKTTSKPSPLHNIYSHLATAFEYMSVYVAMGTGLSRSRKELREQMKLLTAEDMEMDDIEFDYENASFRDLELAMAQ